MLANNADKVFRILTASFLTLLGASQLAAQSAAKVSSSPDLPRPPYLDPSLPVDQRVDDLVSRMTLDEKASQMQDIARAIPRLGIPAYNWWNEGLHGVARAGHATVFPQAIGLAATWDTDLVHRIADVVSTEARAKYNDALQHGNTGRYFGLTFWSPNINIFRDPRWGRGQETYGEDPFQSHWRSFRHRAAGRRSQVSENGFHPQAFCRSQRPGNPASSLRRARFFARFCRHVCPRISRHGHGGPRGFRHVRVQRRAW